MNVRAVRWAGVVVVASACAPCPTLDEVPIEGGSEAFRATVRDAIDRWAARVIDPDSVCVRSVQVSTDDSAWAENDYGGRYYASTRHIEIRESDPPLVGAVNSVMSHELCHAWDFSHPRLRPPEALPPLPLAKNVGVVRDRYSAWVDKALVEGTYDAEENEREFFAHACDNGPGNLMVLAATGAACGAAEQVEVAEWISEHVYLPYEGLVLEPGTVLSDVYEFPVDSRTMFRSAAMFGYNMLTPESGYMAVFFDPWDGDPPLAEGEVIWRFDPHQGERLESWEPSKRPDMQRWASPWVTDWRAAEFPPVLLHLGLPPLHPIDVSVPAGVNYTAWLEAGGDGVMRVPAGACTGQWEAPQADADGVWFVNGDADAFRWAFMQAGPYEVPEE